MQHSDSLILLCGMPRSGTSWIGKIFDSHPRTIYKYEPDNDGLAALPFAPDLSQAAALAPAVRDFAESLVRINTTPAASTTPVLPKAYRNTLQYEAHKLSVMAAKAGSRMYRPFPVLPFASYRNSADVRLVWKSIASLGRLGIILRVLDKSRAIILLRHPCAYIASLLRGEAAGQFNAGLASEDEGLIEIMTGTAAAKRRNLTSSHVRKLRREERLAWYWLVLNEKAAEEAAGVAHCTSLRYEDVCADPINAIRSAFAFTGLDFHEQTADFIRRSTNPAGTPAGKADSYYGVFKNPSESANRWKQQLTDEQIRNINAVLAESDLKRFYPCESDYSVVSQARA